MTLNRQEIILRKVEKNEACRRLKWWGVDGGDDFSASAVIGLAYDVTK